MRVGATFVVLTTLLVGTFAVVPTTQALGAMYLRMSLTPPSPQPGETAQLSVQTGAVTGGSTSITCLDQPGTSFVAVRSEEWGTSVGQGLRPGDLEAEAVGPGGQRVGIPLSLRAADTSVWEGEVTFGVPGEWIVHMVRPQWGDEDCAGTRLRVTVPAPNAPPSAPAIGLVVALLAAVLIAATLLARHQPAGP